MPVSILAIVTKETPDRDARSCCVQLRAVRAVFRDVIIFKDSASMSFICPNDIYNVVNDCYK